MGGGGGGGGGVGSGNPGVKGAGSLWEAGEERVGSRIHEMVGLGINKGKFHNIL